MIEDLDLLYLQAPVGKGQENSPDDVEALDGTLRKINAYAPPAEYADNAQRYTTEPMIGALERYQEQKGLKIDGVAKPGGPTERSINNDLLGKPGGAGLLYDPPSALAGTVGSGFENRRGDVASVQRRLGALDYLPEDPFDKPHGFIDENTTNAIKSFQRGRGLTDDGWLAANGETERALNDAIRDLARANGHKWFEFAERAGSAQVNSLGTGDGPPLSVIGSDERSDVSPVRYDPRYDRYGAKLPKLEGGWSWRGGGARRHGTGSDLRPPSRISPHTPGPDMPGPRIPPNPPLLPPITPWDEEIKRALQIPPLRTEPQIHIPEPGSPLRIPIIDGNPDGRPGKPDTVQQSKDISETIEKACREVFGNKAAFKQAPEHYYSPNPRNPGQRHGGSYADYLLRITVGTITIDVVTDTYTPKVEKDPVAAEERRFLRLQQNMRESHGIMVRVPKAWALGQTLDTDGLYKAAKELCEQIKKMLDRGELDADKFRLRWPQKLKELVKPKPEAEPKGAPDPR